MDYKRIQIDSIAIGVKDVYNIDLLNDNFINTYLTVGNISSNNTLNLSTKDYIHNLIVSETGIGVNTSRNILNLKSNDALVVNGNIHCIGSIYANNIILDEISTTLPQTIADFKNILNRLSSHLLFYNTNSYIDNNIYTTHNVIIGTNTNAESNTNAFKISRHCNNIASNIQLVIENNQTYNSLNAGVSIGIIGNDHISPTHIITSKNMPLHFNINKSYNEINELYYDSGINDNRDTPVYKNSNYPSLALDINYSVVINSNSSKTIQYTQYSMNIFTTSTITITEYPKLYVNGSLYADNIIIYDYISKTPKNLDDIYIRQGNGSGGLTLFANQIRGGNFNKEEFTFNSNVYIGTNDNNYKLKVFGDIETTKNLITSNVNTNNININNNLIVKNTGISEFNNTCYFKNNCQFSNLNCDNSINSKSLTITDTFIYQGSVISFNNLQQNAVLANQQQNITLTNYLNVGGKVTGITDANYNNDLINIYKYNNDQINKFELYLNDTTIAPYGSKAYIGHCPLNNLLDERDNSLVILTQYNTLWNNIYFYAGKNKTDINQLIPNLAIMENNKIGINTNNPEKTLDVRGDIITSNYFYREGSNIYKCKLPIIYNNYTNIPNLNININDNNIQLNQKKFNVIGGINSYDGYYENNYKLVSIKIIDNTSNAIIENMNIGLGINIINQQITTPFQIINTNINNNKLNNSTIVFYRSVDNSKYSGIEFCDDSTNANIVNKNKWFIYKNHITDDINFVGPLQIGYIQNGYKPRNSCINLYYDNNKYYIDINNPNTHNSPEDFNKNKENMRITGNVKITGDLDIDGSINIKGNYKFNDNNILFSPNPLEKIISKVYSLGNNVYYFDTIFSSNYPTNISFSNKNIASTIYSNINDDNSNPNNLIDIETSTSNLTISYNNYLLSSNISNDIILYSNSFSLNTINPIVTITEINSNITNANNLIDIYNQNPGNITSNILVSLLSNNTNYAYSNYLISSNIYTTINKIRSIPLNSFILQASNSNTNALLNSNIIINKYELLPKYADTNVIKKLSSNIYTNSLNNYNNAVNYNSFLNSTVNSIFTSIYLNTSYTEMTSISNMYIESNNYYMSLKDIEILSTDYKNIITSNYELSINNSNNILSNTNSINTFINKYTNVINLLKNQKEENRINLDTNYSTYTTANHISNILNIPSYYSNAILNSNIAIQNYLSNTIFEVQYNNYNNTINDIYDYSNIYLVNSNLIKNSNTFLDNNYYTNYDIYHTVNFNTTIANGRSNEIYNNTSSNFKYSSNILNITSNIYTTFNNIKSDIDNYKNIYTVNSNLAYNNYISTSNIYDTINNNYKNLSFIVDINNIILSGYSNKINASNIYANISGQKSKIDNISNLISTNITYLLDDITSISNINNTCSNYDIIKQNDDIINVLTNNKLYSYNIHLSTRNITSNILYNNSNLYENLSNSINSYNKIYLETEINKNKSITNKIVNSFNNNYNTYISSSLNNYNNAITLNDKIYSITSDYNEDLNIYRSNIELNNGIGFIINYLTTELAIFNTYKSNLHLLFENYIIEDYFRDEYDTNLLNLNFCINLLTELLADANDLRDMNGETLLTPPTILLELSIDITNKYINFINNSYTFANSTSKIVEVINNNIDIYIKSSLSLIPLLNTLVEYANSHLQEAWEVISHKIVLFASISYSLNVIISSTPSLNDSTNNNVEGKNTDVLIIGNNIKLYPNKSLIIGYENNYTRWLELINDVSKKSVAYFFNSEYNSCISSFNCRAQKFKSSISSSTSLKTSTSIDINLIDTSIKDYEESMFSGVSLKLSHIYHRETSTSANATSNNTIFEIVRKQNLNNPYFSIYSYNNNNILNIGNGDFYDINNKCISDDTVVHIYEKTSKHLLKLSNNLPISILLNHNTSNNWILSFTDKINFNFSFNSISNDILTIHSNSLIINDNNTINKTDASLYINNYNNSSVLTLKNNYDMINVIRDMNDNNITITYTNKGIVYSEKNKIDSFEFSKVSFEVNKKVELFNILYKLNNYSVSFNNINSNNKFKANNNNVYILPDIKLNDPNIIYTFDITATQTKSITFTYSQNNIFTINYIIPFHITDSNFISLGIQEINTPDFDYKVGIVINENNTTDNNYDTIEIDYDAQSLASPPTTIKIRNSIKYYKNGSFNMQGLNITIKNYAYNIIRTDNIVPKSIYNNSHTNTITTINNGNIIVINNNLDYLITNLYNKYEKTYQEKVIKYYPITINDNDYNIPIDITINDKYYVYFDAINNNLIPIEYININEKIPMIKQKNIYDNYHNIYSYTNDYEIYFNETKLLNIDNKGTLTTTGNIHTNNIYLNGDIFNSQGISLYDNILSLIHNITTEANFELNSKNIILNPAIGLNNYYNGGVIINGTTINEVNNNLFQINNYVGNDNFITLNSCNSNSYIHFNNKIIGSGGTNVNSLYRVGSENNIFGIWKYKPLSIYNENYYIDTTTPNSCNKVFDITPINGSETSFNMNLNGTLLQTSDSRLKTDIKKIDNALDKIMKLNGITYISSNGNNEQKRQTGLIAQEVKEVLPEATNINTDGYYNIAYGNLAGLIIEAIKELKTEINELKARII
jgi:hypothetical protein